MERWVFQILCLPGMAAALAVFFSLGTKRRASISPFVWWLCLILGIAAILLALINSTTPSFANRTTMIGKAYDHALREHGRNIYSSFRLVPDAGEPVNIETEIFLPGSRTSAIFDGRTLRVLYLQDSGRTLKNEAIDIEILSGKYAGFHESRDARPAGAWLGIPIGASLFAFGLFGLKYRKDDAVSAQDQMTDVGRLGT